MLRPSGPYGVGDIGLGDDPDESIVLVLPEDVQNFGTADESCVATVGAYYVVDASEP